MTQEIGKTLIVLGMIISLIGLFLLFRDRFPGLERLGKLPGDFAYEKENFKFYFPLGTSILISVILTLVLWAISKFRS